MLGLLLGLFVYKYYSVLDIYASYDGTSIAVQLIVCMNNFMYFIEFYVYEPLRNSVSVVL